MKRKLELLVVLTGFGLAVMCFAQSKKAETSTQLPVAARPYVRTITTLGGSPKQCAFAVEPLLQELGSMPYPADWSFLLVCTDAEWGTVLRMADIHGTDTAFTILPKRTTVLRAMIFLRPIERGYENTLWHELGHIQCYCMSEDKANKYAYDHER